MRSRKYNDQRQIVWAASDVATQIVSPTKRFFQIVDPLVGIATMFCMVLPDARTIRLGTPFIFENASSNFVGVYNADLTTFHRLMPRGTLTCTLKTQATASGTWGSMVHDPAVGNPAFGLSSFVDFTGTMSSNTCYDGEGYIGAAGGAGSGIIIDGTFHAAGSQGIAKYTPAANATGWALHYSGPRKHGLGCRAFEGRVSVYGLSTAAEEYIVRFGFGDNITGGAHTEGCYLIYDRYNGGGAAQPNWMIRHVKTAGGAGTSTANSNIAVTADTGDLKQKLRLEINSSGNRVDYFIDNVQASVAGGVTANIPTVNSVQLRNIIGHTNSAYTTTTNYTLADYLRQQSYPTTPR